MHAQLYNEAIFTVTLRPQTPLLIKSGSSGEEALDPTRPDMSFVRTRRPDRAEEEVYIPGASLRGVLRSHAEKLVRSIQAQAACDPTDTRGQGHLRKACFAGRSNTEKISGPEAYSESCYACRLFGNTVIAGRARVGDLSLVPARAALLERRYGVAIDRVTGAVAQGPFEIETLTDAFFAGRMTVRNFTIGQLGLLAAALLDVADGLVPMGYGKSRGLGRVSIDFEQLTIRTLQDQQGALLGVGALAWPTDCQMYGLPAAEQERLPVVAAAALQRGFHTLTLSGKAARSLLEEAANRWPKEVGA